MFLSDVYMDLGDKTYKVYDVNQQGAVLVIYEGMFRWFPEGTYDEVYVKEEPLSEEVIEEEVKEEPKKRGRKKKEE